MFKKHAVKFRVIFNDAHANFPKNNQIPQGGVSSFASKFSKYFKKQKDVELISLLFSHNNENKKIFMRKSTFDRNYYELVYPREKLLNSYKIKATKKEYIRFLEPWIKETENILLDSNANLVFLNGFGLTNWIMMEAANRLKIPSIIQHAGLWKKEIETSNGYFSSSISKIFSEFERETHTKTSFQIFLNDFSKDEFFNIHKIKKPISNKTTIIPLPIEIKNSKKIKIEDSTNIGIVARWDRIKNHGAVYRLARYIEKNKINSKINIVVKINNENDFIKKYKKSVNIIEPMSPDKLKGFYDKQDIVIIPSRFDVSPTVLMEAMLRGKPVLISNKVGWISDFEKFNLDNLIFDYKESGKRIYEKIENLIKNKKQHQKNFEKFQDKIIKEHSEKKVFLKYYQLFKEIIKCQIKTKN